MLQPEPVALLGQFISTIEQSNSPILIGPRGPGDASASRTKLHILSVGNKGGRRRRETAAVGECSSSSILMCANSPAPAD